MDSFVELAEIVLAPDPQAPPVAKDKRRNGPRAEAMTHRVDPGERIPMGDARASWKRLVVVAEEAP